MHITYTKKHLNGTRSRFAVQCETMEQVREYGVTNESRTILETAGWTIA